MNSFWALIIFMIQIPLLAQTTEVYEYKKNNKDARFEVGNQAITIIWKKQSSTSPKELNYYGLSEDYRLIFENSHASLLYRGPVIVAKFENTNILIHNKTYNFGEERNGDWVFTKGDSIVVKCIYDDRDGKS